ncbi:MAG: 6-phosphofructokinase [Acidobacteriaceae bacterium]
MLSNFEMPRRAFIIELNNFTGEHKAMRVGLLTGGGDCPGLNAVIGAVVRKGILHYGDEFVGFIEGWRGVLENTTVPLTLESVDGIITKGGTILRTSRTNIRKIEGGLDKCVTTLKANKLDALIAIGGDDTQSVTNALIEKGVPGVGVPKTIDNDLNGTDVCFGFDTAVSIATEAIDRLHTTAESHNRVIVCEVMGRDAGWIALTAGVAGNAHVVLVPEKPIDLDHVCKLLKYNHDHGKKYGIVVVAEGAKLPSGGQATVGTKVDQFGHAQLSGVAAALAEAIEKKTGYETRSVNLGHTQRGGTPTAYDRMLATRYGLAAIDLVHKGEFGRLVVLHGTKIESIPLAEAISKNRTVDDSFLEILDGLEPKV